jgi:FkbM family methyltransferase
VKRASARKQALRAIRGVLAGMMAGIVSAFPSLEPAFVRAGRAAARRSRLLSGLYWFVQERLMARLRQSGERFRVVHVLGRRLQLDITEASGRIPYFYGTPYEPGVTDAVVTALKPGDVFIDVGAHFGYFAVLAAAVVGPRGRVIAFEPQAAARDALETTIQRNEAAARVDVVACALADTTGEATMFVDGRAGERTTIEPSLGRTRRQVTFQPAGTVPITTLDAWLAEYPGLAGRVRCVKIDVEGAEARALAGMAGVLRNRSLTIVCETLTGGRADTLLTQAGFERQRIEAGASSFGNFLYVRP